MKVSTINLLCWTSAAAFGLGLGAFVYDFSKRMDFMREPYDKGHVQKILDGGIEPPKPTKQGVGYQAQVVPTWHQYDWTGTPPPPPQDPTVDNTPKEQPKTQVDKLLAILYLQVDTDDPGGSRLFVRYQGALAAQGAGELRVGDSLPAPYAHVALHRILYDGAEFSFAVQGDEEPRENEYVAKAAADPVLIHQVEGGKIVKPKVKGIPTSVVRAAPRTETREISRNNWELGTEDVEAFGQDYARILSQDVRTRTHIDKDGRRAGVEITHVKEGSIAARHGAKQGDIVISINGHPVSSEQEAIKFVKNNSDNYTVWEVVVENMGRRTTKIYHSPDE